jgi:hypothetical protein
MLGIAAGGTHWGAIAVGVGGIATAAALLVSLFLLAQQMRDRRQARADRRLDHASHIAFWLELNGVDEKRGDVGILAHVENTSARPAMSLALFVGIRGDVWADASSADGTEHDQVFGDWSAVAVGPGDKERHHFTLEELPQSVIELVAEYKDPAIIGELLFSDAAGVGWVRTARGQLIERGSALWVSLMPLSLTQRDAHLRESAQPHGGIKQRLLYWAIARLR